MPSEDPHPTSPARCSRLTRRGLPCRNPALPDSQPPTCRRHLPPVPTPARRASRGAMPVQDESPGAATNLSGELALVRRVLRRLVDRMEQSGPDIPLDELRHLAGLIFAGAKTAAQLLGYEMGDDRSLQGWLAPALEALSDQLEVEL